MNFQCDWNKYWLQRFFSSKLTNSVKQLENIWMLIRSNRLFWYFQKGRGEFGGWKGSSVFRAAVWGLIEKRNHYNQLTVKIRLFILLLNGWDTRYVGVPCSVVFLYKRKAPTQKRGEGKLCLASSFSPKVLRLSAVVYPRQPSYTPESENGRGEEFICHDYMHHSDGQAHAGMGTLWRCRSSSKKFIKIIH